MLFLGKDIAALISIPSQPGNWLLFSGEICLQPSDNTVKNTERFI